ncbi:MAG: dockerin type I repeat-containing protein [Ruminococcus sp.]|nr:dockerin type I repeat-containing protein [Ruminococcus sp.]
MKIFKKILALALVVFLIVGCCVFSVNAAIPPQKYGDVDGDQFVTITDATAIQMYLAQNGIIYNKRYEAADVDRDSIISILDVTMIQMHLAGYDVNFPVDDEFYVDQYLYGVILDYDSGKAMVGVPVDFKVDGYSHPGPTNVKLYVDGELVAQTSEHALPPNQYEYHLSHTFKEAGAYHLKVSVCDKWGVGYSYDIENYVVVNDVEDKSKPVITSIRRDSLTSIRPQITATAQFGTAPYQYKFVLEQSWFIEEEPAMVIKTQEFSDKNTFDVELDAYGVYRVKVTVRDANGNETTESSIIRVNVIDPA